MSEYLRLAVGTVLVFLPGAAVSRALGGRTASEALAWTLACLFAAWAVVFAVHADIRLAALLLAVIAVAALAVSALPGVRAGSGRRLSRLGLGSGSAQSRLRETSVRAPAWTWLAGLVLGWLLWPVAGAVIGDGLFHEGRVRKLVELGNLHLRTVDEFKDGGLHPGYAFPLWHSFDAVVAWLSGLDPEVVLRHEPSLLAPLALAVAYEAGAAVFRSRAGGIAVAAAQVAIFCLAPGHGGAYTALAQPGTGSRQLLVPAALTLFFARRLAATAAIFGALAFVHPTYALFLLIPLLPLALWEWRSYVAALVPMGAVFLWLRPLVAETNTHTPSAVTRANDLVQYRDQLVVVNEHHFRLAAEVFGRSGAVAVAALVLLPVIALALRRRWAWFLLGGSLLVLCLMEIPWLFVHFSDGVSLSQSRRAAGFLPFPFVFAAGLALVTRRLYLVPLALAAGIALQLAWPGDFAYGLRHGGPAAATWVALLGGAAALAAALLLRRGLEPRFGLGALAALAFVLPVAVHGFSHWTTAHPTDPLALSPRLVHDLRTKVPKESVVIAPIQTSYRVVAVAPLYVVAAPLSHVANTKANASRARYDAVKHWLLTNDPAVPKRYGATWAIRAGRLYRLPG